VENNRKPEKKPARVSGSKQPGQGRAGPPPHHEADRFIDNYLLYLLARVSFLVSNDFHTQIKKQKVSVPTWRVLATLRDRDQLTIGELCDYVMMQQSTLTKVIDRMTEDGLVDRRFSEEDRRKVFVAITAKGRALVEDLIPRALAHEKRVLREYSKKEQDTLKDMMKALITRLS
tara:strand:- start:467 stop:988 length:522 start_codon:yes stop_codon:yes gene_type:complete